MTHPSKTSRKVQIFTDDGDATGATFAVEGASIRFDSRGTTEGTRAYRAGLVLVLERLGELGIEIERVEVQSRPAMKLDASQRVLQLTGAAFPLQMADHDAEATRKRFHTAAAKVGRPAGAKGGGNGTKKLRIFVAGNTYTGRELESLLGGIGAS